MSICPNCNGMEEVHVLCPKCRVAMRDMGRVEDYEDKYSAYEEQQFQFVSAAHTSKPVCEHLFFCSHCQYDLRVLIDLI